MENFNLSPLAIASLLTNKVCVQAAAYEEPEVGYIFSAPSKVGYCKRIRVIAVQSDPREPHIRQIVFIDDDYDVALRRL